MSMQQIDFKDAIGSTIKDIKVAKGGIIIVEFTSTYSVLAATGHRDIDTNGWVNQEYIP